ncbi:hypothetical protein BXP70_28530, partial [Hymenobacter crusticola]
MIRLDDILSISCEYLDITDERRERYKGFITPDGKAYVIHLSLRDGRSHRIKCLTREFQTEIFASLGQALHNLVIPFPPAM